MGFTSRAKMVQMGVHDMIWGRLTDAMAETESTLISLRRFVHPRVEPELAFLHGKPLAAKVSLAEALDAVVAIALALEIIDSRFENFRFSLSDVIADNASSSGYVIGPWNDKRTESSNLWADHVDRRLGTPGGQHRRHSREPAAFARRYSTAQCCGW